MSDEPYDVVVVGAGPAGTTAAITLARKERRVALVDRSAFPRDSSSMGWISAAVPAFLADLDIPADAFLHFPVEDVALYNADYSRTAKPSFEGVAGYMIDRTAFNNALFEGAVACGADPFTESSVADIRLFENGVAVELTGGKKVEGRLLILATGWGTDLADRLGIGREGGVAPIWTSQVESAPQPASGSDPARLAITLGLDKVGSFGVCCMGGGRVAIAVNWLGERTEARAELVRLSRALFEHDVVSLDLSEPARQAPVLASPASLALDMDSHVAKHALVIGAAGGFVSAASNEGIYPAMWSAAIAADVIVAALQSRHSQDELMAFDSNWRLKMADYLRSPNTDNQFLLPLIFANQPMADRMGAAFFFGENI